MRVGFHTFGCKLNQYETESLASSIGGQGVSVVPADQEAEVYIVSTCTVTARADHKARAFIRGLARSRPGALLVVTGCSAQLEAEALSALAENVVVVPQAEKADLLDLPRLLAGGVDSLRQRRAGAPPDPFAFNARVPRFHTRAFLKVQDGCDCRCSYCRVPLARGPGASLDPELAAQRARELEDMGCGEIVITGVNISSWRTGSLRLPQLLAGLLSATRSARLRLSSLEPEGITAELAVILAHPRICPHFHLPVQSGSDAILGLMKRSYRSKLVPETVSLLREAKGDPFLAADLIVGFPGESEEDFQATRTLVLRSRFSALHVFPFSARPGTLAASMRPRVPERIRGERARDLGNLSRELAASYARSWIGREVEVLLEGKPGISSHQGVSENYLKVAVRGIPQGEGIPGEIARARLAEADGRCKADFLEIVH